MGMNIKYEIGISKVKRIRIILLSLINIKNMRSYSFALYPRPDTTYQAK